MASSPKPGQTCPSRSARICRRTTPAVWLPVTSRARPMIAKPSSCRGGLVEGARQILRRYDATDG
jgi:hypothetical protein